jgi:hypothetical protein
MDIFISSHLPTEKMLLVNPNVIFLRATRNCDVQQEMAFIAVLLLLSLLALAFDTRTLKVSGLDSC